LFIRSIRVIRDAWHGAHLENYLVLVGEYLAGGQKDWPDYLAEIRKLEAQLLGEGD